MYNKIIYSGNSIIKFYHFKRSISYIKSRRYLFKIIFRDYLINNHSIKSSETIPQGSIVFVAGSFARQGGLVDCLKGIISLYDFAIEKKIDFFIYLDPKADFMKFLQIKKAKIHLTELNRNMVSNKIFFLMDNSYIRSYHNIFTAKRINHVYTNLDLSYYQYGDDAQIKWRLIFNKLFNPSNIVNAKVAEIIGTKKYIVCAFRFMRCMGDFNDGPLGSEWDEETKKIEVSKLNKAVEKLILDYPDHKVYIASDSETYLSQLCNMNTEKYFYNPNKKVDMTDLERSVIELLVISQGEKIFQFQRPDMYIGAFSKYASYIGNADYRLIKI